MNATNEWNNTDVNSSLGSHMNVSVSEMCACKYVLVCGYNNVTKGSLQACC